MPQALEIEQQYVDAWNRRDLDACRKLCHQDFAYTGPDGKELTGGPDVSANIAQMYMNAFPDGALTIDRSFPLENGVVVEMTGRGTHKGPFMGTPASGKKVELKMCCVVEMRDGKIWREREYFDLYSLMTQIGAIPAAGRSARTA